MIEENCVRLLKDAAQNYLDGLNAIVSAKRQADFMAGRNCTFHS